MFFLNGKAVILIFVPPLIRKNNRGRVKRRVGHNLLLRLKDYASDILCFLSEPDVPSNFRAIHNYNGEKSYSIRASEDIVRIKPGKIDTMRSAEY